MPDLDQWWEEEINRNQPPSNKVSLLLFGTIVLQLAALMYVLSM